MFLVLDFELPMNWVPWWRMLGSGLLRTRNYLHTRSTRRSTLKSMSSKSVRSRLGGLRSCLLQFLFPWRSMCTFTCMHVRSVIQVPAHRLFFSHVTLECSYVSAQLFWTHLLAGFNWLSLWWLPGDGQDPTGICSEARWRCCNPCCDHNAES